MTSPKRTEPTNATRQAAWRRRQAQSHAQALAAKGLPAMPTIATLPGTSRWSAQRTLVSVKARAPMAGSVHAALGLGT